MPPLTAMFKRRVIQLYISKYMTHAFKRSRSFQTVDPNFTKAAVETSKEEAEFWPYPSL